MWWSCLHTPCAARVAGDASDAGSEADERPLRQGREEDPLAGHACSPYDCAAADRQQPHASSSGRQAGAPVAERAAYGALSRLAGRTAGPAVDGQHGCSPTSVLSVGSTESPAQRRSLLQRTRPSPRGGSSAPPRRRQDREGGAASRAPGPTGRSQRSGPNQVEVSERALLAACAQGAWDGAVRLLDAGVDVDAATTSGRTCLHLAVCKGNTEVVALLLGRGADADLSEHTSGWGPLHTAAHAGHGHIVALLLQFGASVEASDKDGQTPLCLATWKGHAECVSLLFEYGACPNTSNKAGWHPMHLAAAGGHTSIVSILARHGGHVNAADSTGWTPLHEAAAEGHTEVVGLLLGHGARIGAVDAEGRTPVQVAGSLSASALLAKACRQEQDARAVRSPAHL